MLYYIKATAGCGVGMFVGSRRADGPMRDRSCNEVHVLSDALRWGDLDEHVFAHLNYDVIWTVARTPSA